MSKSMALVESGVVVNLIQIRAEQVAEFEYLGIEIIPFAPLDVWIGDAWDGVDFWRDGEKLVDMTTGPTNPPGQTMSEDARAALERLGVTVYEED